MRAIVQATKGFLMAHLEMQWIAVKGFPFCNYFSTKQIPMKLKKKMSVEHSPKIFFCNETFLSVALCCSCLSVYLPHCFL